MANETTTESNKKSRRYGTRERHEAAKAARLAKLALVQRRRGESKRETARLLKQIAARKPTPIIRTAREVALAAREEGSQ